MGQLHTMASTIVAGRGAELNGSGVIADCRMKILPISNETLPRWSTWLPVSLHWETTDLGSLVNLSIRENPIVAPSTDPIILVTGSLSEYPLLAEIYAMQSSLAFTSLTLTAGATLQALMWKTSVRGLSPVSDELIIGLEELFI